MTIHYTEIQGDLTTAVLEKLEFHQDSPRIIAIPLPVYTDTLIFEPYVLSLSTGSTALDAYLLDAPWVKRYSATNWLAPLADLQQEDIFNNTRPELVAMMSRTAGGDTVPLAVPFETKGNILFYRADLLEKYGLDPPETWGQLINHAELILNGEQDDELYGMLYHGPSLANDFYPVMWSFGGGVFSGAGELRIDQPANVQALAMLKLMSRTICPDPLEMDSLGITGDYRQIDYLFAGGRSVFMLNWNTRWNDLAEGLKGQSVPIENIGVAPIPREGANPHYSNIGSFGWGVNLFSPHQRQAKELIRFITSYESQVWRAVNAGVVPARTDVLNDPAIQRNAPQVLRMAEVFDQVVLRARPYQKDINEILDDLLLRAVLEDLDPLETLRIAQRRARASLDRFKNITSTGSADGR